MNNTTGTQNAATGYEAPSDSPTGNFNTANGYHALKRNTTGTSNTAVGNEALSQNTTATNDIALRFGAGNKLTSGDSNIEIGSFGTPGETRTIRVGRQGTQRATFIAGITGETVAGGVGVIIDTNGHLGTVTSSSRYKEAIQPMVTSSAAIFTFQGFALHLF